MVNHTAAPWLLVDDDGDLHVEVPSKFGAYRIAENIGGKVHKDADGKFTDYSEVEANARLIAAAPDLLAELSNVADWLSRPDERALSDSEVAAIHAAIAKATGEQP